MDNLLHTHFVGVCALLFGSEQILLPSLASICCAQAILCAMTLKLVACEYLIKFTDFYDSNACMMEFIKYSTWKSVIFKKVTVISLVVRFSNLENFIANRWRSKL